MLRCGDDSVSAEAGCAAVDRLAAVALLVVRRAAGRDLGVVVRGLDAAFGFAVVPALDLDDLLADVDLDDVLGLAAEDPDAAEADRVVRALAVLRDLDDARGAAAAAAAGLAVDMVLAAALSALAAFVIALVAVFIARMADDIVFADAVALVAAAVIFEAAVVTLVAADDTPLAAVAGVVPPRPAALRVERVAVERDVDRRVAVDRDVVDRDPVLRVERDAVLRVAGLAAVLRVDLAEVLRVLLGAVLEDRELDMVGRLAVPPDALRLADLPRAVLAELLRLAARVVD